MKKLINLPLALSLIMGIFLVNSSLVSLEQNYKLEYEEKLVTEETFNLNDLFSINFNRYVEEHLQEDFLENDFGGKIPINQFYPDDEILGLNWNEQTDLSIRQWINLWTIDAINIVNKTSLEYGDIMFIFDFEKNSSSIGTEKLNNTNNIGFFIPTAQGISSGRVQGTSEETEIFSILFEGIDINVFTNSIYFEELNTELINYFDNREYGKDQTWYSILEEEINQIIYDTFIDFYFNEYNLSSNLVYDNIEENNITIDNLNFIYTYKDYDTSTGHELTDDVLLSEINSFSVEIEITNDSIFYNSKMINPIIEDIDINSFLNITHENKNSFNYMLMFSLIFLILLFLNIALLYLYYRNKKYNKTVTIEVEK